MDFLAGFSSENPIYDISFYETPQISTSSGVAAGSKLASADPVREIGTEHSSQNRPTGSL